MPFCTSDQWCMHRVPFSINWLMPWYMPRITRSVLEILWGRHLYNKITLLPWSQQCSNNVLRTFSRTLRGVTLNFAGAVPRAWSAIKEYIHSLKTRITDFCSYLFAGNTLFKTRAEDHRYCFQAISFSSAKFVISFGPGASLFFMHLKQFFGLLGFNSGILSLQSVVRYCTSSPVSRIHSGAEGLSCAAKIIVKCSANQFAGFRRNQLFIVAF